MPRMARAIAVGCAHHITPCGNNRQDVFFVEEDILACIAYGAEMVRERYVDLPARIGT